MPSRAPMRHVWGLLSLPILVTSVPGRKYVYGKYFQLTGYEKDDSDNSYWLYTPPQNLDPAIVSSANGKLPVMIQLVGNSWIKLEGPYRGAFKHSTPAIDGYLSNGIAFISANYRTADVDYSYMPNDYMVLREELIHVDNDGRLSLDTTGRRMKHYMVKSCWQETITKAMYDAVQMLEHVIANADANNLDIHKIFFITSSAGTAEVNYLTWVYHAWNTNRFTPVGMITTSPQFDLPVYCGLDEQWKSVAGSAGGPNVKLSSLMDVSWCRTFVGNEHCTPVPEEVAALSHGVAYPEMCNYSWHKRTMDEFCDASKFNMVTVGQLLQRQTWSNSDPDIDVSRFGMEKLWYVSKTMPAHPIVPFHLYVHSQDHFFLHHSMYALAYAKLAQQVNIDYTAYWGGYDGVPQAYGTMLHPGLLSTDQNQKFYKSSVPWRDAWQDVKDTLPGSVDEHLLYVCFVLGLSHCAPKKRIV